MITECKAGKLDLVITKSVSRFARNVVDFLGMVRMLSERNPPIGVFFEAENIFSLNETSNMALSFQATMAEEESRNKSRSMETSLRMRLDHGLPLTPKLLGFTHNSEGKLIPDPDTMHIPKLMFYMYLYGYSTQQIAGALTALEKKTYLGNVKWTSSGVAATMRNERYCGDVYTRKTFTKDVLSHKSVKNRGERPISHYYSEHEGIISRDDFIAVQHMLKNAKYGNKSILPELRVITEGLLKGFVIINPRWSGFREQEYLRASASAYPPEEREQQTNKLSFEVEAGDFDMRGFEIAHTDLFDVQQTPHAQDHIRPQALHTGRRAHRRCTDRESPWRQSPRQLLHCRRNPAGGERLLRAARGSVFRPGLVSGVFKSAAPHGGRRGSRHPGQLQGIADRADRRSTGL